MSSLDFPIDGAYMKLWRAKQHLDQLWPEVMASMKERRDNIVPQNKPEGIWIEVPKIDDPRPELGLLIGDAVHNMRAALDYTAFELARANAGREVQGTQFPLASYLGSPDPARKNKGGYFWARSSISALRAQERAHIRRLQPYQRRNRANAHPLSVLRELSNADKHRLLQVIGVLANVSGDKPARVEESTSAIHYLFPRKPLELKADVWSPGGVLIPQPHVYVDASFTFKPQVGGGFPLIMLRKLGWITTLVVDSLARSAGLQTSIAFPTRDVWDAPTPERTERDMPSPPLS